MGGDWLIYGLLAIAIVGAILPLWGRGRRKKGREPLIPIRPLRNDDHTGYYGEADADRNNDD